MNCVNKLVFITFTLLLDYLKQGHGRFVQLYQLLSSQNLWQFWIISFGYGDPALPLVTESTLNIHKTFKTSSKCLLHVKLTSCDLGVPWTTWESKNISINVNSLIDACFLRHHWPWHSHPPPLARFATAAAYDLASITRNGKGDEATFVTILEQKINETDVENTNEYDCSVIKRSSKLQSVKFCTWLNLTYLDRTLNQ